MPVTAAPKAMALAFIVRSLAPTFRALVAVVIEEAVRTRSNAAPLRSMPPASAMVMASALAEPMVTVEVELRAASSPASRLSVPEPLARPMVVLGEKG